MAQRRFKNPPKQPWLHSIAQLVSSLQDALHEGCRQDEIVDMVKDLAQPHGFNFRSDAIYLEASQIDEVEEAIGLPDYLPRPKNEIMRPAHRPDPLRVKMVGRVILCRQGHGLSSSLPEITELSLASAIILNAITWQPLAITPRACTSNESLARAVNHNLGEGLYEIIRPGDGSLVTLYPWQHPLRPQDSEPVWCLATGRGYDVFPLTCPNGKTWAHMLMEVMSNTSAFELSPATSVAKALGAALVEDSLERGDVRISFTEIPVGRCYTINVRNHTMHPLLADPQAICNVQSVDLTPDARDAVQKGLTIFQPSFSEGIEVIEPQVVLASEGITYEVLCEQMVDSLERAVEAISSGNTFQPNSEEFNYGYILRSKDVSRTQSCSDVIIESPLLARIRHHMYRKPRTDDREFLQEKPHLRMAYNALRGILTPGCREEVLGLFPQYTELAEACDEFLKSVAHIAQERARKATTASEGSSGTRIADRYADVVLQHIEKDHSNFNPFDSQTSSAIIEGYLYDAASTVCVLAALGYS